MRVILVHDLEDCRTALQAANNLKTPVVLQTAPDAAHTLGIAYLRKIFEFAHDEFPTVDISVIVDCGAEAGQAMEALASGFSRIRFSGAKDVLAKLQDIARQKNAEIVTGQFSALDLRALQDQEKAVAAWLSRPDDCNLPKNTLSSGN